MRGSAEWKRSGEGRERQEEVRRGERNERKGRKEWEVERERREWQKERGMKGRG